jgi:hypothetical protein
MAIIQSMEMIVRDDNMIIEILKDFIAGITVNFLRGLFISAGALVALNIYNYFR